MPIRTKAVEAGILGPDELELLGRVFRDTAIDGESDHERETRASRIIGYFTAGVTDEAELGTLAKAPLGR